MSTKLKDDLIYVCNDCGNEFKANEIKLEKKLKGTLPSGSTVIFVNKDGKLGRAYYHNLKDTDRLPVCPHCNRTPFGGFDIKSMIIERVNKNFNNMVQNKKLMLGLAEVLQDIISTIQVHHIKQTIKLDNKLKVVMKELKKSYKNMAKI